VLGWASAYATGVVPVDLPPITGAPPPLGDAHDEHPEGLGPGLPLNVMGVPMSDPLAQIPMIDLTQSSQLPSQSPMFPWMTPTTPPQSQTQLPGCTLICIDPQSQPPGAQAPGLSPPPAFLAPFPPPAGLPPAPPAAPPWAPPAGLPPARPRMHHPQISWPSLPVVLPGRTADQPGASTPESVAIPQAG